MNDVSVPDLDEKGNHVLIYNASAKKYELVPADQILSTAASDSVLPDSFINQLDQDLDNKIDFDGGSF